MTSPAGARNILQLGEQPMPLMPLIYYQCLNEIAHAYSTWAGTDAVSLPAYRYYCMIAH